MASLVSGLSSGKGVPGMLALGLLEWEPPRDVSTSVKLGASVKGEEVDSLGRGGASVEGMVEAEAVPLPLPMKDID